MVKNISVYNRSPHYYETDQMGVVHHSNYIRWFEEARLHFMEQAGFSYKKMEDLGVLIPVISVECQYKYAVKFGDEIRINVKIDSFNGVKMSMFYEVYHKNDNRLCVIGKTSHCFVNDSFKIINLKKSNIDIFNFFNNLLNIN